MLYRCVGYMYSENCQDIFLFDTWFNTSSCWFCINTLAIQPINTQNITIIIYALEITTHAVKQLFARRFLHCIEVVTYISPVDSDSFLRTLYSTSVSMHMEVYTYLNSSNTYSSQCPVHMVCMYTIKKS